MLELTRWFLAMQLVRRSKNHVSTFEVNRRLDVYFKTVWLFKHELMEVMRLREGSRQITGRV
jgi:hypothetical protein